MCGLDNKDLLALLYLGENRQHELALCVELEDFPPGVDLFTVLLGRFEGPRVQVGNFTPLTPPSPVGVTHARRCRRQSFLLHGLQGNCGRCGFLHKLLLGRCTRQYLLRCGGGNILVWVG